jgi:hypothetical protein
MKIVFERIGRTGSTPAAKLTLDIGPCETEQQRDAAVDIAFLHVQRNLASRDAGVWLDFDAMTVEIDGGRFGRGRIEP